MLHWVPDSFSYNEDFVISSLCLITVPAALKNIVRYTEPNAMHGFVKPSLSNCGASHVSVIFNRLLSFLAGFLCVITVTKIIDKFLNHFFIVTCFLVSRKLINISLVHQYQTYQFKNRILTKYKYVLLNKSKVISQ